MGKTVLGMCPECDAEVHLPETSRCGDRVHCPRCRSQLAVIGLNPLELDWAFIGPTEGPSTEDAGDRARRKGRVS